MRNNDNGARSAPYMMIAQRGTGDEARPAKQLLRVTLLFCAALVVASPAWAAVENRIAVVYPDIGEPYRGIFEKIIEGIEAKVGDRVAKHPLNSDTDTGALNASLFRENSKVVIALGRQGMRTATMLNKEIGVVVGGVLSVPESEARGQPVISLSPDPALLFARMKALMPATKRVFVVYDPALNGWLIKLAKEAARAQELELVAQEAQDLRSAVRYYQQIFSAADGHSDVLWLPQDTTTVEESTVLPMVLQESWNRDIAVFSSNSAHVRRGVLFSLYPDNPGLGKSLAELALGFLRSGDYARSGMMPLRDVQSAVNLRTAQHLRLKPGRLQDFDTTFPEQ
jgi:putative tryptophan/tyrosine transport system substrate-binding protein